jgi:hypothetical protein
MGELINVMAAKMEMSRDSPSPQPSPPGRGGIAWRFHFFHAFFVCAASWICRRAATATKARYVYESADVFTFFEMVCKEAYPHAGIELQNSLFIPKANSG